MNGLFLSLLYFKTSDGSEKYKKLSILCINYKEKEAILNAMRWNDCGITFGRGNLEKIKCIKTSWYDLITS